MQVHKLVATKAAEARDRFNEITHRRRRRARAPCVAAMDFPCLRRRRGVPLPRAGRCRPRDAAACAIEDTEFTFGADYDCTGFNIGRVDSSHEGEFDPIQASRIREHNTYDLPLVCRTANNAFAIGEADLRDYGGLYLGGPRRRQARRAVARFARGSTTDR